MQSRNAVRFEIVSHNNYFSARQLPDNIHSSSLVTGTWVPRVVVSLSCSCSLFRSRCLVIQFDLFCNRRVDDIVLLWTKLLVTLSKLTPCFLPTISWKSLLHLAKLRLRYRLVSISASLRDAHAESMLIFRKFFLIFCDIFLRLANVTILVFSPYNL